MVLLGLSSDDLQIWAYVVVFNLHLCCPCGMQFRWSLMDQVRNFTTAFLCYVHCEDYLLLANN